MYFVHNTVYELGLGLSAPTYTSTMNIAVHMH